MRLLIHDYAGHAFPVQLSRWLAGQGHTVRHLYSAAVESPRGPLAPRPDDPPGLHLVPLAEGRRLDKYRPLRRLAQEAAYTREVAAAARAFRPDAALSGNCSPAIQHGLARAVRAGGGRFVYWLQDLYAPALQAALGRRLPGRLGGLADTGAGIAARLENAALRAGDAVVTITPDFGPRLAAAGVPPERRIVLPNWAPLPAAPSALAAAASAWREAQGLSGRFVFLYTGTLGLKHSPDTLAALARAFRHDPEVRVVVATQGPGRTRLDALKAADGLDNLILRDFLPADAVAAAQRAADVLLAVLTPAAAGFSVPSKVLAYLAAGRPVLAAIPADNLAARVLAEAGAGEVVPPGEMSAWLAAAWHLRHEAARRERLGAAGAAWAAAHFDIARIGPRFQAVLAGAPLPADGCEQATARLDAAA